jgi:phosphoserine phosphatase
MLVKEKDETEVDIISQNFFKYYSEKIFNRQIIDILKTRHTNGSKIYIVSSNYDFLLKPLQKLLPVEDIISTSTEKRNNIFTGKLIGNICSGKEKLNRSSELFKDDFKNNTVGFGDSRNDYDLLNACSSSFLLSYKKEFIIKKIFRMIQMSLGSFDFSDTRFEIVPFKLTEL